MSVNTKNIVSITEVNEDFSKVAKLADEDKSVFIMKDNKPKYILLDYEQYAKDKLINFGIDIAKEDLNQENILEWVKNHK